MNISRKLLILALVAAIFAPVTTAFSMKRKGDLSLSGNPPKKQCVDTSRKESCEQTGLNPDDQDLLKDLLERFSMLGLHDLRESLKQMDLTLTW